MKYKFGYIPSFAKELKTLCKKYKSLKKDFEALKEEIETNPNIGVSLGDGLRKIRLNISSKNKGKSGGARVIIQELDIIIEEEDAKSILFVCIYDKSEYDSVDINIIKEIIEDFRKESSNTSSV